MNILNSLLLTKVNWSVKAGEHTSFFHGMLKKRRRQIIIRGVSVDGDCVIDPTTVKTIFMIFMLPSFKLLMMSRCLSGVTNLLSSVLRLFWV